MTPVYKLTAARPNDLPLLPAIERAAAKLPSTRDLDWRWSCRKSSAQPCFQSSKTRPVEARSYASCGHATPMRRLRGAPRTSWERRRLAGIIRRIGRRPGLLGREVEGYGLQAAD